MKRSKRDGGLDSVPLSDEDLERVASIGRTLRRVEAIVEQCVEILTEQLELARELARDRGRRLWA